MVDSLLYLYILIIMLYFDDFMNELVDHLKDNGIILFCAQMSEILMNGKRFRVFLIVI